MIAIDFCQARSCFGADCLAYRGQRQRERTLGVGLYVEPGLNAEPELIKRLLRRSIEASHATTSTGVAHQMPSGIAFQVHTVAGEDGSTTYEALYCGDEPVDGLLAKSPVYAAP